MRHHFNHRFIALALVVLTIFGATSCKKRTKHDPNKVYTEIPAAAITGIDVQQAISVRFTQVPEAAPKIEVSCKKEYAPNIDVRMEGTTLVAGYREGTHVAEQGVEITISAPAINSIKVSQAAIVNLGDELKLDGDVKIFSKSAGSVKCKKINCQSIYIDAAEASVIQLSAINCNSIEAQATSSALLLLDGKAINSTMSRDSRSDIRCGKLQSEHTTNTVQPDTTHIAAPKPAPAAKDSAKKA